MKVISKRQELKDVTITHVSYVKRGANKKTFLLSKSEERNPDVEFDVRVLKEDDSPKKLLYGVVYEPDSVDAHGDMMIGEEIEKTAHEFMIHYRNIDSEHNLIAGAGQVVESYIAPADMEIGKSTVKKGSWILVTKATDEIWQDYVNGDITGYSMFGIARTTVAKTEDDEPKVSWVQKFLEKLGVVKSFEETLNGHIEMMKQDPGFILYMMEEDWWTKMSWDSTKDEDLVSLANSMKEAASYIDSVIASKNVEVTKSDDLQDNIDADAEVNVEAEPVITETDESETEVEVVIDETEIEAEPEEIPETEPAIDVEKQKMLEENEQLKQQYEIVKSELDKLKVNSAVVSEHVVVQPYNKPKPKLF